MGRLSETQKFRVKIGFTSITKRYRVKGSTLSSRLDKWKITQVDIDRHKRYIELGKVSPSAPIKIDWAWKLHNIQACSHLLPKFQQFMFWIVTGTLTDGKRRDTIHVPDCGVCPACPTHGSWALVASLAGCCAVSASGAST